MITSVGLAARFFSENLLDHDHFLEWFLTSFEAASIGTIPIWLLMLGIYWNSIMRYRRRGRRLAELLLQKVRQVRHLKTSILHILLWLVLTIDDRQLKLNYPNFSLSSTVFLALSENSFVTIPPR